MDRYVYADMHSHTCTYIYSSHSYTYTHTHNMSTLMYTTNASTQIHSYAHRHYKQIHTYTHLPTYIHINSHKHTHSHIYAHMCTLTHTHIYMCRLKTHDYTHIWTFMGVPRASLYWGAVLLSVFWPLFPWFHNITTSQGGRPFPCLFYYFYTYILLKWSKLKGLKLTIRAFSLKHWPWTTDFFQRNAIWLQPVIWRHLLDRGSLSKSELKCPEPTLSAWN